MNEWLNETVDPVLHSTPMGGEVMTGVPTCYMRSPATPMRRGSGSFAAGNAGVIEMAGRSAKKRWLRQAIIDETDPHSMGISICSSPNSRPGELFFRLCIHSSLKTTSLKHEQFIAEKNNFFFYF